MCCNIIHTGHLESLICLQQMLYLDDFFLTSSYINMLFSYYKVLGTHYKIFFKLQDYKNNVLIICANNRMRIK